MSGALSFLTFLPGTHTPTLSPEISLAACRVGGCHQLAGAVISITDRGLRTGLSAGIDMLIHASPAGEALKWNSQYQEIGKGYSGPGGGRLFSSPQVIARISENFISEVRHMIKWVKTN